MLSSVRKVENSFVRFEVFLFKHKTAYEMSISDWSSDVCSSDLRRAASLAARRSVKKEYQAAWLVQAIRCIDLTTLGGDDTPGRVERLCRKAMRRPVEHRVGKRCVSTGR